MIEAKLWLRHTSFLLVLLLSHAELLSSFQNTDKEGLVKHSQYFLLQNTDKK